VLSAATLGNVALHLFSVRAKGVALAPFALTGGADYGAAAALALAFEDMFDFGIGQGGKEGVGRASFSAFALAFSFALVATA
jgi:hypothetical protein